MVGHLHLQAMDESLKGKNREGLLDSPDSGLPPSPSPPFYSLSPGILESRSGSCSIPNELQGYCRKESREGKLVCIQLMKPQSLNEIQEGHVPQSTSCAGSETVFISTNRCTDFRGRVKKQGRVLLVQEKDVDAGTCST